MPILGAGEKAPSFTARTSGGGQVDSASFHDNPVLLCFYPGNNTPG